MLHRKEDIKKKRIAELKTFLKADGTYSKDRWIFCHPSYTTALKVKKYAESLGISCSVTKRIVGNRLLSYCMLYIKEDAL